MKKNILLYILILSFLSSPLANAKTLAQEEKPLVDKKQTISKETKSNKKGFWIFSKKDNTNNNQKVISEKVIEEMKPNNDAGAIPEQPSQPLANEKLEAINYANSSLMSDYFNGDKNLTTNDGIVEGIVQKDNGQGG